jgi:hypothetical protein
MTPVRWLSEDKYMNLKVVVEIDGVVDAQRAAEVELKRHCKALGLPRIVADRGLQVICYSYFSTPSSHRKEVVLDNSQSLTINNFLNI